MTWGWSLVRDSWKKFVHRKVIPLLCYQNNMVHFDKKKSWKTFVFASHFCIIISNGSCFLPHAELLPWKNILITCHLFKKNDHRKQYFNFHKLKNKMNILGLVVFWFVFFFFFFWKALWMNGWHDSINWSYKSYIFYKKVMHMFNSFRQHVQWCK